ncbi:DUF2824 family protein [Escherichia coli]
MGVVKLADYRPQLEVVEHRVADTEDGFMRVANEITDSLLMADLTVRQMKVMLAIMRKTYGFNKPMDRLTNTQIAAMTGIHHTHVCAAKRQLIERKFLIADGVKIGVNKVVSQWISQDSLTLAKTANKTLAKSANTTVQCVTSFAARKFRHGQMYCAMVGLKRVGTIKKYFKGVDDVTFYSATREELIDFLNHGR